MHTDQSPCEVWRSSITLTHPQPCWAEVCEWHGCVLLPLRSAVGPSGYSAHVREPSKGASKGAKQVKPKQVMPKPKLVRRWGSTPQLFGVVETIRSFGVETFR